MPRLRRTPDKLVFLVNIAALDKMLLIPALGATAFLVLADGVILLILFGGRTGQIQQTAALAASLTLGLALLLLLDLILFGPIYVFDRPGNRITAYRGPFQLHSHALSDLIDVDVKVSTDMEGDLIALGSLLFRSGAAIKLNSIPTASTRELLSFQRQVRAFLPPSPERTAREEAERQAAEAERLSKISVPLGALWKAKGLGAVTHPRESMTFLAQFFAENGRDPVIRDLLKSALSGNQDPAAQGRALQEAAQKLRERGDPKSAERLEEAARRLLAHWP